MRALYEREKAELLAVARAPSWSRAALPAPLERYLDAVQPDLHFETAVVKQRGALRLAQGKPWMPFEAEQVYSLEPPAFVWFADARVAPLVHMLARDKFMGDRGHMLVKLFGMVTVANARGRYIDQGAALRYWGEIITFAESIRSPRLSWEAIDDHRVKLVADDITAVVEFDEDGFLSAVHAQRYRHDGGRSVLTPWSGILGDWQKLGGRMFPTRWESIWHLADGDFSAVKIDVLSVATNQGQAMLQTVPTS